MAKSAQKGKQDLVDARELKALRKELTEMQTITAALLVAVRTLGLSQVQMDHIMHRLGAMQAGEDVAMPVVQIARA